MSWGKKSVILMIITALLSSPLWARAGGKRSSGGISYSSSLGNKGAKTDQSYRNDSSSHPFRNDPAYGSQRPMQPPSHLDNKGVSKPSFFQQHPILTGLASGLVGSWIYNQFFGSHATDGNTTAPSSDDQDFLGTLMDIVLLGALIGLGVMIYRRLSRPSLSTPISYHSEPSRSVEKSREHNEGISVDDVSEIFMKVQKSWSQGDLSAIRFFVTSEIFSELNTALTHNISQGVVNILSDISLLDITPIESWEEDQTLYSCVQITFVMVDRTLDQDHQVVAGSDQPQQDAELWTFSRHQGEKWLVCAIEQKDEKNF